jgi:hypothetical protein
MENTTKGSALTHYRESPSVSSEMAVNHPIVPNTAEDNLLGDYYDPVWDGPEKSPKLKDINTEADE